MSANDPWTICDASGFKCKLSETRLMWNGRRVRADFWEPRHPQDRIRAPKEQKPPKDTRSEPGDPPVTIEFTQDMII